ncbi:MAG: hypothetical protein ACI4V5_08155 [Prevotella sp.]
MYKVFCLLFLLFFVFSCSETPRNDMALRTAKEYYDSLFAGHASYFVKGTYLPDSIPAGYMEQLIANAKMFKARQDEEHLGVTEVRMVNCVTDTVPVPNGNEKVVTANAFLMLCYGDSLKEEIVVPMIEHKGRWLMR